MMADSHWDILPNDVKEFVLIKRTRLYFQDCMDELLEEHVQKIQCVDAMIALFDHAEMSEQMCVLYNKFRRSPFIIDLVRLLFKGASSKYIVENHFYSLQTLLNIHRFIQNL